MIRFKRLSGNSDNFNEKKKISKPNFNPPDTDKACNHCGFSNHTMDKCVFRPGGSKEHPDANPSTTIFWTSSDKGKAWAEKGEKQLVNDL